MEPAPALQQRPGLGPGGVGRRGLEPPVDRQDEDQGQRDRGAYGYGYDRGNHYGHYDRDVRRELRECRRELRRADSRREYYRELRECRREIARARYGRYDDRYGYGRRDDRRDDDRRWRDRW